MDKSQRFLISISFLILSVLNALFLVSWGMEEVKRMNLKDTSNIAVLRSVSSPISNEKIRVEVFNACGVKDIAKMMTDYLRKKNVDVVYYGNYFVNNQIYSIRNTLVIDRQSDNLKYASEISRILNVNKDYVIYQLSPEREVDVTILIGKNYLTLNGFR